MKTKAAPHPWEGSEAGVIPNNIRVNDSTSAEPKQPLPFERLVPDIFLRRFGSRAGVVGNYFYTAIRKLGATTPETILVGVRAIGSEEWEVARTYDDHRKLAHLPVVAAALREDPGGALAFAAEALRRERLSPAERAAQKADLARLAAIRGKRCAEASRLIKTSLGGRRGGGR